MYGEREARREATRRAFDQLQYELMHNLVIETTRMSIEVKNLKMRVESLSSRLDFNERRARALESVVVYKPNPEDSSSRSEPAMATAPPSPVQRDRQERHEHARGPVVPKAQTPVPGNNQQSGGQAGAGVGIPGPEGPGQRSRRRRRRRGRRGGGSAVALMGAPSSGQAGSDSTPPAGDPLAGPAFDGEPDSSTPHAVDQESVSRPLDAQPPTTQGSLAVATPPPAESSPPANRDDPASDSADDPGQDHNQ
jgi:hypothetical protein